MPIIPAVETITSREAADRLGVSVQSWHRIAHRYQLVPAVKGAGLRGPAFWHAADVERIRSEVTP